MTKENFPEAAANYIDDVLDMSYKAESTELIFTESDPEIDDETYTQMVDNCNRTLNLLCGDNREVYDLCKFRLNVDCEGIRRLTQRKDDVI